MTLSDAHCHLQDNAFAEDLPRQLAKAALFGIHRFVVNGTCPEDWVAVARLAETHPACLPQFGVHPWKVENLPMDWEEKLKAHLLRFPRAGLGEIGLDGQLTDAPMARQIEVLTSQLEIARTFQRACSFHLIKAWPEFDKLIKVYPDLRFVLHSFCGSSEQVKQILPYNCYFSFGGALIRHNHSQKMKEALRAVPAERLLLETDAPFQSPEGKDHRHEPAGLLKIAETAAAIRDEPLDHLLPILESNINRLFLSHR